MHPLSNDRIDARVVDVSPRGMRLRVPTPLEPGIQIKVRLKTMIAFGEVRYCVKRGDQYYAGVQLHDVMENH